MHTFRHLTALSMLLAACSGGDGKDTSSDTDDTADTGDTDTSGVIDTTAYEGTLAWTVGTNRAVLVRDLEGNELVFEQYPELSDNDIPVDHFPTQPALSPDGSTLAFVTYGDWADGSEEPRVHHVDLATGDLTSLPRDITDEADLQRNGASPTVSGDGSLVAYVETRAVIESDGTFGDETDGDIAVWTTGSEPVRLTTHEDPDYGPMVTADGETVFFVSQRDEPRGDFYKVNTSGTPVVERVSVLGHPDIDKLPASFLAEYDFDMSDDGRFIVFQAGVDGVIAAFLLDTTTGDVTRVGDQTGTSSLAISGDGSTMAYLQSETDPDLVNRIMLASTSDPSTTTTVKETAFGDGAAELHVDLSQDGSFLAVGQTDLSGDEFIGGYHLVLMRDDGSERTLVATEELDTFSTGLFHLDLR